MTKKFATIFLSLFVILSFTSQAFSQGEPVNTDDKVVNENDNTGEQPSEKPAENTGEETQKPVVAKEDGKVYNNGETVYINSKVKLKLSSKDNVTMGEIYYKINDGAATKYAEPISFDAEGKQKVSYYGIDLNGNTEMEKVYEVVVDKSAPEIIVSTSRPLYKSGEIVYFSKKYDFIVSSSDKLSGVSKNSYAINGESKPYSASFTIQGKESADLTFTSVDNVNNATDEFTVTVVDAAGTETKSKVKSIKLTADNEAPTVKISSDKELKKIDETNIAKTDFVYSIAADDKGSGVKKILYRVDGKGEFISYTRAITFSTNGEHMIEAKAVDNVNNTGDLVILKVVVDMVPPETIIETITK
jgi:hypothetical protein